MSHTGSWTLNFSSVHLYWSDEYFGILGLHPKTEIPTFEKFFQMVHQEDRLRMRHSFEYAVREKNTFDAECRIVCPYGIVKHIHSVAHPVINAFGTVTEYVGTVIDITERKDTEEALRESESHFRRYFELGLVGMAMTSPDKRILDVNNELCRILGYDREELLQKRWTELTHPDDLEADIAQFNRVMAGEIEGYTLDKRWIRKDSRVIDSIIGAKCLRRADGLVEYFVGLVLDVSERRRAEEKLQESERRFHLLVESIPHHVWSVRPDGTIGYWNQRLVDYTGFTSQELRQGGWSAIHPDDQERARAAWQKAFAHGTNYEMEQRMRGRDGSYRRFVSRGVAVKETSKADRSSGSVQTPMSKIADRPKKLCTSCRPNLLTSRG